ncbi:MAG TPA: NAD(P)H-dependent oxidoreductase [Candidatus Paceibacterota bacterium]|nr:NAD(P)H-dependent oxidoreductase [Candidatus Paceibacterota bacterium]
MRMLIFNGSAQKDGTIAQLAARLAKSAEEEALFLKNECKTKVVHLADEMKSFHEGSFDTHPKWFQSLGYELAQDADAFAIVTGVHWGFPSDLVVSFLEQLTPFEHAKVSLLSGKVAGVLVHEHEGGAMTVAAQVKHALGLMSCDVPPNAALWVNKHMKEKSERYPPDLTRGWMEYAPELVGQVMVRKFFERISTAYPPNWSLRI